MIEYEELRTDTGYYLIGRFKYYKSLVFPTKNNVIATRRNNHVNLHLYIKKNKSQFLHDCLIIS